MFIFMYYKTNVNLFLKKMYEYMQGTDRKKLKKHVVDKYILTASAPVHACHCSCDAKINSAYLK